MRALASFSNRLYSVAGDKIIGVDLDSGSIEMEFDFPQGRDQTITFILLSDDGASLFACYTNKWCVCFSTLNGAVLGSSFLKKRPTAVAYGQIPSSGSPREALLIADKNGEIWAVDCPSMSKPPVFCGGHTTSVITDMKLHGNFVYTSDRDEKIRITNFPSMVKINSYCLGHTSVITSITTVDFAHGDSILISTGWDRNVIAWNSSGDILGRYLIEDSPVEDGDDDVKADSVTVDDTNMEDMKTEDTESLATSAAGGGSGSGDVSSNSKSNKSKTNEDDDEAEDEEKFNEAAAGFYPLKLVHFRAGSSSVHYLAIIYKDVNEIHFFELQRSGSSSSSGESVFSGGCKHNLAVQIIPIKIVELPAVPIDVYAIDGRYLFISFPGPHYHVALSILSDGFMDSISSVLRGATSNISAQITAPFNDLCTTRNLVVTQIWSAQDEGNNGQIRSEDRGLKKASVDDLKRYNSQIHRKGRRFNPNA